jgi:hypothetical protein
MDPSAPYAGSQDFFLVEIPKGKYNGQVLTAAVASGMIAMSPSQLLKAMPSAAMATPMTILTILSTLPIFCFMVFLPEIYDLHY